LSNHFAHSHVVTTVVGRSFDGAKTTRSANNSNNIIIILLYMPADRNVVGERSETSVSPPLVTAIIIYTRRRVLGLQLLRCRYIMYINPRGTGIFDRGSPIRIIVRPRTHLNQRRRTAATRPMSGGQNGFFLFFSFFTNVGAARPPRLA